MDTLGNRGKFNKVILVVGVMINKISEEVFFRLCNDKVLACQESKGFF